VKIRGKLDKLPAMVRSCWVYHTYFCKKIKLLPKVLIGVKLNSNNY